MQACRLRSHTVDVTPPQAATKIMAGMAEQQTEWLAGRCMEWSNDGNGGNGGMAERMAEWLNGGNDYIRTIYGRHIPMLVLLRVRNSTGTSSDVQVAMYKSRCTSRDVQVAMYK